MNTNFHTISDKVIELLNKAVVELEAFQVQATLGKMEAAEKFEELKEKVKKLIANLKSELNSEWIKDEELKKELLHLLDKIALQLEFGKEIGKDVFLEQKQKLVNVIKDLEQFVKSIPLKELSAIYKDELEKLKIKSEILRLRYELGKYEIKDEWKKMKADLPTYLHTLRQKLGDVKEAEFFWKEVEQAYDKFRKAF